MKMMFHIDDFKCTICQNWYCPPFYLPYLLPCTHSICTNCFQKAENDTHIICPLDLSTCSVQLININLTTKKALQRLMKEHKNFNENTQLQCIKNLSIGFDQILSSKEKKLRNLQALIDQIFYSQIQKLKQIHNKIKININRPFKVVEDWKQIVTSHLSDIRENHHRAKHESGSSNRMIQINHYIEQGRKIKMELNQFFQIDFDSFADELMRNPKICFDKNFSLSPQIFVHKGNKKTKQNEQMLSDRKTISIKQRTQNTIQQKNQRTQFGKYFDPQIMNHSSQNKNNRQGEQKEVTNSMIVSEFNENKNDCVKMKKGNNKENVWVSNVKSNKIKEVSNFQKYISLQTKNEGELSSRKGKCLEIGVIQNQEPEPINQTTFSSMKQKLNINEQSQNLFQVQTQRIQANEHVQENNQKLFRKEQSSKEQKQIHQILYKQIIPQENHPQNSKSNQFRFNFDNKNLPLNEQMSVKKNRSRKSIKYGNKKNRLSRENSLLISPNPISEEVTNNGDQIEEQQLLNQNENNWQMGHINFLKEWIIKNNTNVAQPLQIKQNTYYYNCEQEKLNYIQKMQLMKAQQLYKMTEIKDNQIQLINQSMHDADMNLYLQQFDWKHSNIQIVKFVKTDLNDQQLNILLNYVLNANVKTLVLSYNHLTDICLDAFLNFVSINKTLKNVHLSNNPINNLKNKHKINILKEKGIIIW